MEIETNLRGDEYVDWRGKKEKSPRHGGVRAASLVCVVEALENVVFLSNAINFVAYFLKSMHYSSAESANMVTNFMGTSFLLTLVGGFISDSFFTRFRTFLIFCTLELLGLILLTFQAKHPRLQPPLGKTPSTSQAAILYVGLYAMAAGVGGVKASLPAHGADQLDRSDQRAVSAFFNWFFFALCLGGLGAATGMVWVQENKGWDWSFNISIIILTLALCIFTFGFPFYRYRKPSGSPLSRIFKVLISAARNWKVSATEMMNEDVEEINPQGVDGRSSNKFRFLNKALIDDNVTAANVKETKTFLGLLPIFASTIMMNCCLAQLQTFTVQQGHIMNKGIGNFTLPTQSLTVFPLIIMLASISLYEIFSTKVSGKTSPFPPLWRIGMGLSIASGSMAAAAVIEARRRSEAQNGTQLSVFWLGWQYLFLGVSDMFVLGGMLEFFYSEAPSSMRSMCTALSWCSTSMGYFISSILVTMANMVTQRLGGKWLGGKDLNHTRLDLFYALLCVLNFLNLLNFIYWAKRY